MPSTQLSETISGSRFANPRLAEIVEFAQIKSRKSYWKSFLYEVYSWLVIPFGVLLVLPVAWGFGVATSLTSLVVGYIIGSFFGLGENAFLYLQLPITGLLTFLAMLLGSYIVYREIIEFFFKARRSAKRYRLDDLSQLASTDKNPVLYLRSFSDDKSEEHARQSLTTYEEDFALALNSIGPVIAVGKQFDDISPLGATRIYLKNDHWQENVKRLMQISQLVVLHAGTSKGLLWEIETLMKEVDPHKLLITFLAWQGFDDEYRQNEYLRFKGLVEQLVNESESDMKIMLPEHIEDAKFLVFDNKWKPKLLKTDNWNELFYKFSAPIIIRETLRPVLIDRNIELSKWRNAAYVMYMLWLIMGSLWQFGYILLPLLKIINRNAEPFNVLATFAKSDLIVGVPLLLFHFSTQAAFFIAFNWLLNKFFAFLSLRWERLFALAGKIVPSRSSGLQKPLDLNDED